MVTSSTYMILGFFIPIFNSLQVSDVCSYNGTWPCIDNGKFFFKYHVELATKFELYQYLIFTDETKNMEQSKSERWLNRW